MPPDEEPTRRRWRREVNVIGILKKTAPLGALLMVLGGGTAARASVVEAKVPFDFMVRGKTLPAGDYVLERDQDQLSLLVIHGKDGARANLVVFTEPAGDRDPAGEKPVLRFTREGSQYRLADVWLSRDEGWEIERSGERR